MELGEERCSSDTGRVPEPLSGDFRERIGVEESLRDMGVGVEAEDWG